jgi:uncharacterized coiled-coil protein SlyX
MSKYDSNRFAALMSPASDSGRAALASPEAALASPEADSPRSSDSPRALAHEGVLNALDTLARTQRAQLLETQKALKLGSLSLAMTARNTTKCRQLEADCASSRQAIEAVQDRTAEQQLEIARLETQIVETRGNADRQTAELRVSARAHESALSHVQGLLATYRGRLQAVQSEQRSKDGLLNLAVLLAGSWLLSSPLVAAPLAALGACLRLLGGRRSARSVGALLVAMRLALLAAVVTRARRGLQRVGILGAVESPVQLDAFARALASALASALAALAARWRDTCPTVPAAGEVALRLLGPERAQPVLDAASYGWSTAALTTRGACERATPLVEAALARARARAETTCEACGLLGERAVARLQVQLARADDVPAPLAAPEAAALAVEAAASAAPPASPRAALGEVTARAANHANTPRTKGHAGFKADTADALLEATFA